MSDEFAKVSSILESEETDENAQVDAAVASMSRNKQSLMNRLFNKGATKAGNVASAAGKGLTNIGTRFLAGGMAAIQTMSVTSLVAGGGIGAGVLGALTGGNDSYVIEYYDDITDPNPYECIDEYSEAYRGIFGTLNTSPLASQNNLIVTRLREINEWSKAYVGQEVGNRLLCNDPECPYYQLESCPNPDHMLLQTEDTNQSFYQSGAQIDLANVKRIHSFFSEYGLTDVQIAAICGVATVESHIDFTSLEGYNIQGDRYGLDPSAQVGEYGFKPFAENLNTPTCIHELATTPYSGTDAPIDYAAYSAEYPAIDKLGIGMIGFTDGDGFYNNTFLRNFADEINDRVTMIQAIAEGGRSWQEQMRQRAADLYNIAYGATGETSRGTGQSYISPVSEDNMLCLRPISDSSSGSAYQSTWNQYLYEEKLLTKYVKDYQAVIAEYEAALVYAAGFSGAHHQFHAHAYAWDTSGKSGTYSGVYVDASAPRNNVTFEYHTRESVYGETMEDIKRHRWVTATNPVSTDVEFYDIFYPQSIHEGSAGGILKEHVLNNEPAVSGAEQINNCDYELNYNLARHDGFYSYMGNKTGKNVASGSRNYSDVVFRRVNELWELDNIGPLYKMTPCSSCYSYDGEVNDYDSDGNKTGSHTEHYECSCHHKCDAFNGAVARVNAAAEAIVPAYIKMMVQREKYIIARNEFNAASTAHAIDTLNFYNALQDTITANTFDLEAMLHDATFNDETVFDDTKFYTKPAYEYKFNQIIDGQSVTFHSLFNDDEDTPTPQELKLYYELWQNYAKYNTNLPQNGKYINWWVPEVQLLFLVGGSYDVDTGEGLTVRDEYLNIACSQCSPAPSNDTTGKYYYDWMSTWKGDDYTGRDLTAATKNFFYDMVSGGFDDGTLQLRTEYAMAYYYMFQYDSPYQQTIQYASNGGEAATIMEEMIAEGRWQTNTSNTLSDTAMPHNDKWKEYQTTDITRQWDIDSSTSMSTSILSTLGTNQNHSRVNLLTDVWTGCRYINVINNNTIGNAAMYLVDDPLIYGPKDDKFYVLKYGVDPDPEPEPVSNLYNVVYNAINRRLIEAGKSPIGDDDADADALSDGFTFVKTAILWSGLDKGFEDIKDVDELKEYIEEATSSVWQTSESYQTDPDSEKAIGRGNSKIWEQRRLGPYYDGGGSKYYQYSWVLVPRVLETSNASTNADWYNGIREGDSSFKLGDVEDDEDDIDKHGVDEHNTSNIPSTTIGYDTNGYKRKLADNNMTADWVRVDWECWDKDCPICHGNGGHGDEKLLCPGDILIKDDTVAMWLGEQTVQAMYPLESQRNPALVIAGGDEATKLKTMAEVGFKWELPYDGYTSHADEVGKPIPYASSATASDSASNASMPYNPDGKWTVYRLTTSNYTDAYRNAGIIFDAASQDDWEIWIKYKWKGMQQESSTTRYIEEVRNKLGIDITTDFPRDEFGIDD